jgi:hypothetical protein
MPIIKPLQLEPTSDIEDFAATVFQPKTLSIIYGPQDRRFLNYPHMKKSIF